MKRPNKKVINAIRKWKELCKLDRRHLFGMAKGEVKSICRQEGINFRDAVKYYNTKVKK